MQKRFNYLETQFIHTPLQMHMIVMDDQAFAMRLFQIHFENCKRMNNIQWKFNLRMESEIL